MWTRGVRDVLGVGLSPSVGSGRGLKRRTKGFECPVCENKSTYNPRQVPTHVHWTTPFADWGV